MKVNGRNSFFKAILLVCVLMQAVALMPHHHHTTSDSVCLDFSHLSSNECNDICSDSHNHADVPYSTCSSYNIVVAQPERNDEVEAISLDLPDCGCGLCVLNVESNKINAELEELPDYHIGDGGPELYLRVYLIAARPCRAPDFLG